MQTPSRYLRLLVFLALPLIGCSEPPRPTINLYRAIHAADLDQIKRHIYWGTDLTESDPNGDTPLHVAVRDGRIAITRELLDHGVEMDALNAQDRTPLQVALISGRTQVAGLLLQKGAQLDANRLLMQVAATGVADRDVIAFLVREGADINSRDAVGNTPLHLAIAGGYRVAAKHLIKQGADVNVVNDVNHTPLHLAIESHNDTLINMLKNNGAILR